MPSKKRHVDPVEQEYVSLEDIKVSEKAEVQQKIKKYLLDNLRDKSGRPLSEDALQASLQRISDTFGLKTRITFKDTPQEMFDTLFNRYHNVSKDTRNKTSGNVLTRIKSAIGHEKSSVDPEKREEAVATEAVATSAESKKDKGDKFFQAQQLEKANQLYYTGATFRNVYDKMKKNAEIRMAIKREVLKKWLEYAGKKVSERKKKELEKMAEEVASAIGDDEFKSLESTPKETSIPRPSDLGDELDDTIYMKPKPAAATTKPAAATTKPMTDELEGDELEGDEEGVLDKHLSTKEKMGLDEMESKLRNQKPKKNILHTHSTSKPATKLEFHIPNITAWQKRFSNKQVHFEPHKINTDSPRTKYNKFLASRKK